MTLHNTSGWGRLHDPTNDALDSADITERGTLTRIFVYVSLPNVSTMACTVPLCQDIRTFFAQALAIDGTSCAVSPPALPPRILHVDRRGFTCTTLLLIRLWRAGIVLVDTRCARSCLSVYGLSWTNSVLQFPHARVGLCSEIESHVVLLDKCAMPVELEKYTAFIIAPLLK